MAELPLLALRDVVVYPYMVVPLYVGRNKTIRALEMAMEGDRQIMLVAQKEVAAEDPSAKDLYKFGCIATVLQLLKLPDETVKLLAEGSKRGRIIEVFDRETYLSAHVEPIEPEVSGHETELMARAVLDQFEQLVKLNKKIPGDIASLKEPDRIADTIAAHLTLKLEDKQNLLEIIPTRKRLEQLSAYVQMEIELFQVEKRIRARVKRQMEKSQREYYLREQMKAIQSELSEQEEVPSEFEVYAKKIEEAGMPKEAREKSITELNKLKQIPSMSAEATVSRNYLDCLLATPWNKLSKVRYDLHVAEEILSQGHYGIKEVVARILEYLAVMKRSKKMQGDVLCFVGPPGVGKTSLARSIARATNHEYARISLGGVRDEADIHGHRRTYIGALPGRIIQQLQKVKVRNPVLLIDEIDKVVRDYGRDPAAALLEVLDPEQNSEFNDRYMEVGIDLSDVLFITTANSLNILPPLLDRMEVIRLPGYTEDEKIAIAFRHLIPKKLEQNGLKSSELKITNDAVKDIIRYYTREAGVRNLEREIDKIARKVVKSILMKTSKKQKITVTARNLEKFLGVKRYRFGRAEEHDQVGQVTGLAWTEVGGEFLTIEAATVPGKGKMTYTGQLGEVMQESIQAALTVVRSRTSRLGISADFHEKLDIHVHLPEGAIPKDGPSAGIGICTALVSALTKIPVRSDVAMTGEITLRGEVLPIGGLKEKLLAALRGGITNVVIPEENRRDLKELPKNIKQGLTIHPVRWIDQVLLLALQRAPVPRKDDVVQPVNPGADAPTVSSLGEARASDKLPQEASGLESDGSW